VIVDSLRELGAADAKVVVGYRTEPAARPDLPNWKLTRLEIALKLPEAIIDAMRRRFGVDSYMDSLGPNVFVVLQDVYASTKTLKQSIRYREDFASWSEEDESEYGPTVDFLGEGRLRPRVFDAQVVPYWRRFCEEKHEAHWRSPCWKHRTLFAEASANYEADDTGRVPGLRVIDVQQERIVDYDFDRMEPYYALSYVWGTRPFITLNKANEAGWRKEGSLSNVALPDTIADTIEVVRKMGKKFLWVDSLCILQDDEADQKRFISRMGTIYRAADITIIALCGDNAYAGLPGVQKDKPRLRQQEINIKGVSMLPVMMPTGWADAYKLGETKWITRAWTHQETLLSRRRLIFGREQAYFICGDAILCEDVVGDFSPFIDTFARL
jgi:hypothetical protein